MSIVADFLIPPEAVPSGETLTEFPGATIQLERIVPTEERALPFFWVFDADPEAVLEHLRTEGEIAAVDMLAETDDGALFKAEWEAEAEVIEGIRALRATILEATGTTGGWLFQVRAEDRERLATFQRIFTDQGIPVEVRRIYNFAELVETGRSVTPEQRETLVAAYERGYFDQPRGITQEELGAEFDISGRAVSNRLRRGTRNLVASTLLEPTNHETT